MVRATSFIAVLTLVLAVANSVLIVISNNGVKEARRAADAAATAADVAEASLGEQRNEEKNSTAQFKTQLRKIDANAIAIGNLATQTKTLSDQTAIIAAASRSEAISSSKVAAATTQQAAAGVSQAATSAQAVDQARNALTYGQRAERPFLFFSVRSILANSSNDRLVCDCSLSNVGVPAVRIKMDVAIFDAYVHKGHAIMD